MEVFNFPYYSKEKKLTKEDIFKIFVVDIISNISDNPDIRCIIREYLLSVLFFSNQEKFLELYEKYKDIQIQKTTTGNKKFYIKIITNEMLDQLRKFQPINL